MLFHLQGLLVEKSPVHAVIDCQGVGYHLNISLNTYSSLPEPGQKCTLLTHLHINGNDFSLVLYGFFKESERDIFRKLISVSGVGPNTARMVLSSMNTNEIQQVIALKDVSSLKRIKGIGEKTAERIIIDLHDKIAKGTEIGTEKLLTPHNSLKNDALAALSSLGLDRTKTEKLLDKIQGQSVDITLDELIKQVLKQL
jgi:Holliday junction DNA helicase RuvA